MLGTGGFSSGSLSLGDLEDSRGSFTFDATAAAVTAASASTSGTDNSFQLHFTPDNSFSQVTASSSSSSVSSDSSYMSSSSEEDEEELIPNGDEGHMGIQRSPWEMANGAQSQQDDDQIFFFMPPKPAPAKDNTSRMFQKDISDEESDASTTLVGDSDESDTYEEDSESSGSNSEYNMFGSTAGHGAIAAEGFEAFGKSSVFAEAQQRREETCNAHFSSLSPFSGLAPIEECFNEEEEDEEDLFEEEEPETEERLSCPVHAPEEYEDLPRDYELEQGLDEPLQELEPAEDSALKVLKQLDNRSQSPSPPIQAQEETEQPAHLPKPALKKEPKQTSHGKNVTKRVGFSVLEEATNSLHITTRQKAALECLQALSFYL